jgi:hypothetical protein
MRIAVVLVCVAALAGCTRTDRGRVQETRAGTISSFKPIAYHRNGGRNGADEHVTISAEGAIESRTKYGVVTGKLSEFQIMQLSRAFEDWDKLQPSYPAAKPNPNAATVTIDYGGKTVTASEAAEGLPEQFIAARDRVVEIARDLPQPK